MKTFNEFINERYEGIDEGTTPSFKRLIKRAKELRIETISELEDLIGDEFHDAEPHISGADFEIAKKQLRLSESVDEAKVMSKSDNDKLLNEKMDTKYWAGYNDDTSPMANDDWAIKSKDFEDTFEDAVVEWNREAEGPENRIKGAQIQAIKKLANEFFKIEKYISINIIHAMIAQES